MYFESFVCGGRRNIFRTLNFDVSLCFIIFSAITPLLQHRVFCLTPKSIDGRTPTKLKFSGGWLLTSPEDEILQPTEPMPDIVIDPDPPSTGARSVVTHLVHQEFLDYLVAMHVYTTYYAAKSTNSYQRNCSVIRYH